MAEKRRELLKSLGVAGAVCLAGCNTFNDENPSTDTEQTPDEQNPEATNNEGSDSTATIDEGTENERDPEFEIISTSLDSDEILLNESVIVSLTVENTGALNGTFSAVLKFNGETVSTKEREIASDSEKTLEFSVSPDAAGTYTVSVNETNIGELIVEEPEPDFTIETSINSTTVQNDNPASVTVNVSNNGTAEGTYTASLSVAREKISEKEVTVPPNSEDRLQFTITQSDIGRDSGMHDVYLNDNPIGEIAIPLNGNWEMFQLDAQNSGWAVGGRGPAGEVEVAWSRNIGYSYPSGPVISGNTLFVADQGNLYAYNSVTGELKWEKELTGEMVSTPAVDNNRVYICADNNVLAFDNDSGEQIWRKPFAANTAQPTIVDDTIYINGDSRVYSIDSRDGSVNWYNSDAYQNYPKGVGYYEGKIYYVNEDEKLRVVDDATGDEEWTISLDETINTREIPTIHDGVLNIHGEFQDSFGLDASTGEKLWEASISDGYWDPFISPGVYGDNFFEYTFYRMIARDIESGEKNWEFELDHAEDTGMVRPPVAANRTVYHGTATGSVIAYNGENGVVRWRQELSDRFDITGAPCISDNYVFVRGVNYDSNEGRIYALKES